MLKIMDKEIKQELQKLKRRLTVLLKEFEVLANVKLNFKNGDNVKIEDQDYLITLDHNNKFALSEIKNE